MAGSATPLLALCAGALAVATPSAGQTALQYGFDHTSGTVLSRGVIIDDSGKGHDGFAFYAEGGSYSPDVPIDGTRHCTGIGSISFDGFSASTTEPDVGIVSAGEIFAAGGLTVEAWVRNLRWNRDVGLRPIGVVCTVSNHYGVGVHEVWAGDELVSRRLVAMHGTSTDYGSWPGVEHETAEWTHLAAVYADPTGTPQDMLLDITLFVNGEAVAAKPDARFDAEPDLATSIGNGPLWIFGYESPVIGALYEPRVSLGALEPSQFTFDTCPPDFNGDGVVDTRDVLAFLGAWTAHDPRADFNHDGVIDTRDVLAFLDAWAAGC